MTWQFIDPFGKALPEIVNVIIDDIDSDKVHALLCQHFEAQYPGQSMMDVEEEERWSEITHIKNHIKTAHFKEVERNPYVEVALANLEHDNVVAGIKDVESGREYAFKGNKCVMKGDQVRCTLGEVNA